jgi:hypothetical protein
MALRSGRTLLRRILYNSQLSAVFESSSRIESTPAICLLSSLGVQDQLLSLRSFVHISQQAYQASPSDQVMLCKTSAVH